MTKSGFCALVVASVLTVVSGGTAACAGERAAARTGPVAPGEDEPPAPVLSPAQESSSSANAAASADMPVLIGEPGALSLEQVELAMGEGVEGEVLCYLDNPDRAFREGEVELWVLVAKDGHVTDAAIVPQSFATSRFAKCMVEHAVHKWLFPEAEKGTAFQYPVSPTLPSVYVEYIEASWQTLDEFHLTAKMARRQGSVQRGDAVTPPKVNLDSVVKPIALQGANEYAAGTAALVRYESSAKTYVLTALHLFGPSGGMGPQRSVEELATAFDDLLVVEEAEYGRRQPRPTRATWFGASRRQWSAANDIVVAEVGATWATEGPALRLAPRSPSEGETLWLLKPSKSATPIELRVLETAPQIFCYAFLDVVAMPGTSGAPVVDASGAVIGVHARGASGEQPWGCAAVAPSLAEVAPHAKRP